MNKTARIALLLLFLAPGLAAAQASKHATNVNTRYDVESVSVAGVPDDAIGSVLRSDLNQLVGSKYDPDAADWVAGRLRLRFPDYTFDVKVTKGDQPDHVKVVFQATPRKHHEADLAAGPLLYTTKDGFTGEFVPRIRTHNNYVSFGLVSNANNLLERNTGVVLRYEHHKVGTEKVQVGFEYDYFHPSFQPETTTALTLDPSVPGIYRTRELFEPSVSVLPIPELKFTFGASFQTLQMQYPEPHDQAAHALIFGVQLHHEARMSRRARYSITADYSLRNATSSLESDFLYTRHLFTAEYQLRVRRQTFIARGRAGSISGSAPLFERFSIGSATTLRGWDKFDVAPLGGTRIAYGSLEYRYHALQLFYDFGSVWNDAQSVDMKHSIGIGCAWKNGFFMSLGVPLRYHNVRPVFMFGFAY